MPNMYEPVIDIDALRSAKRLSCDAGVRLDVADLTTLHVSIAELRVAPDGTWLYVLKVTCGRMMWHAIKRYSEIREFWTRLCELVVANETTCTERCHFLQGFEHDKFPKKHLLHTKSKLEERANELDVFFVKLMLRLNLCNRLQLERCFLQRCTLLELLTTFFEIGTQFADERRKNPYAALTSYQKMPLLDNRRSDVSAGGASFKLKKKPSKKDDRRFSFATLQDVRVGELPQSA
uniref:PX domain-containing protein n=1 Tax=Globisporangium ultimum (strain ATCC 200006 / CBS 805.95 / DAOM BR144) TaxID=431595 RepID=K3WFV1_GLOUD